jgi:hypothetical protein
VFHTLKYGGWVNNPDALYRDIVHFNPIRRDLAIQGEWEGGDGADRRWADQLRALGCVKTRCTSTGSCITTATGRGTRSRSQASSSRSLSIRRSLTTGS